MIAILAICIVIGVMIYCLHRESKVQAQSFRRTINFLVTYEQRRIYREGKNEYIIPAQKITIAYDQFGEVISEHRTAMTMREYRTHMLYVVNRHRKEN